MSAKHVVIEVSASRLIVAVVGRGGRIFDHRIASVDQPDWVARWPASIGALKDELSRLVGALGAVGARATIIYDGPTAGAGVFACPVAAGASAAERAAVLALGEQSNFSILDNPSDVQVLSVDPAPAAPGAGPSQPVRNRHTLAIADQRASTEAVAAWAREAGLEPAVLLPLDAPPMGACVAAATGDRSGAATAVLWFGEHASILAAGQGGALRFIRVLRIGTETLADALLRPIRRTGEGAGGEPVLLSRTEARRILNESGIPTASQEIDAERRLLGGAVLPLLQPVLQRFALEIKQSLRFGLSEEERARVSVCLDGPGSLLARLGEVLSGQCGAAVGGVGGAGGAEPIGRLIGDPVEGGVTAWGVLEELGITLAPPQIEQAHALARARKAVWSGVGAALLLVGLNAGFANWSLNEAREERAQLAAEAQAAARGESAQLAAIKAGENRAAMEKRIASQMGLGADWSALLALLAETTPANVRLLGLEFATRDSGEAIAQLSGIVQTDDPAGADPAAVLKNFADRLGQAPILKGVRLGATQRTQVRGSDVQRFELTLALVSLPAAPTGLVDARAGAGAGLGGTGGAP